MNTIIPSPLISRRLNFGWHGFEIPFPQSMQIDDILLFFTRLFSSNTKIVFNEEIPFVYYAEHYPIEGLHVNPKDRLHNSKLWIALRCSVAALEKYPHNIPDDDDTPYYKSPSIDDWFSMGIIFLFDGANNRYVMKLYCKRGNHKSFNFFAASLKKEIENEMLWLQRKHYISLVEGTTLNDGDHFFVYTLNHLVCKQICSYIG